jgi:hypothetical protein
VGAAPARVAGVGLVTVVRLLRDVDQHIVVQIDAGRDREGLLGALHHAEAHERRRVGGDEPHLPERVGSSIRVQRHPHGQRAVGLLFDDRGSLRRRVIGERRQCRLGHFGLSDTLVDRPDAEPHARDQHQRSRQRPDAGGEATTRSFRRRRRPNRGGCRGLERGGGCHRGHRRRRCGIRLGLRAAERQLFGDACPHGLGRRLELADVDARTAGDGDVAQGREVVDACGAVGEVLRFRGSGDRLPQREEREPLRINVRHESPPVGSAFSRDFAGCGS